MSTASKCTVFLASALYQRRLWIKNVNFFRIDKNQDLSKNKNGYDSNVVIMIYICIYKF